MERGWSAKGLLRPLYAKSGGRDELARRAKASPQTLSAINNGRQNIGEALARRICKEAGISLVELGAPAELLDPRDQGILARLEVLEAQMADGQERFDAFVEATAERLAELTEAQAKPKRGSARPQRRAKNGPEG